MPQIFNSETRNSGLGRVVPPQSRFTTDGIAAWQRRDRRQYPEYGLEARVDREMELEAPIPIAAFDLSDSVWGGGVFRRPADFHAAGPLVWAGS